MYNIDERPDFRAQIFGVYTNSPSTRRSSTDSNLVSTPNNTLNKRERERERKDLVCNEPANKLLLDQLTGCYSASK